MKTVSRSIPASAQPSPLKRWIPAALLAAAASLVGVVALEHRAPVPSVLPSAPPVVAQFQAPTRDKTQDTARAAARKLSWRVVKALPHDRGAFLQGLLWDNGGFYESTGLEGRSSLRRLSADGSVLKQIALPPQVFGEGLTAWKDSLIQISWKDGRAWKWDKATFAPLSEWHYEGEGWGITNDGKELIMSDGSDTLFFRDPASFQVRHSVRVTFNGQPLRDLNELEYIAGRVWANVWQTDTIVLIDPKTGVATDYVDLAGILPASARNGSEDVLNGIAYDAKTRRIWVSGKQWPRIFQIEVQGQPGPTQAS